MTPHPRGIRIVEAVVLACTGISLIVLPNQAPIIVLIVLATSLLPLWQAWRASRGTALRAAVIWGFLAVLAGMISEGLAISEPLSTGRPLAGHATYLTVLAALAALVSVLNARTPGGGAWAILMTLLVLVFLIPWLEGPWLARKAHGLGRLRLEAPWSVFYLLVVVAGVTNYLPTRYGFAAAILGLGFIVEYVALTRSEVRIRWGGELWTVFPWTLAVALWIAYRASKRGVRGRNGLEATWFWFRDHWGVVWALRVQERFNRSAESFGWPFRLGWFGLIAIAGAQPASDEPLASGAESTLRGLLRRFAEPGRVAESAVRRETDPCQPPRVG
jgi:hypothetical protein